MQLKLALAFFLTLLSASLVGATTRYVDGSMGADCTGGDYSIANRNCTGSDGNAYNTMQEGLSATLSSDTLYVRAGTYNGDFECCGSGGTTVMNGTASAPTRILGYAAETAILVGSGSQTIIDKDTDGQRSASNIATLYMYSVSGDGPSYAEIGNLTIQPGNNAAIVAAEGNDLYLHDIIMSDLSAYVGLTASTGSPCSQTQAAEDSGIFWLYNTGRVFMERVTVSNGGTAHVGNLVFFGNDASNGFHARMLDISDFKGALQRWGGAYGQWEFVKVRNYLPWCPDDGTFIIQYNSAPTMMRYIDVKEGTNSYSLQGTRYGAGHRNTSPGPSPVASTWYTSWTYEDFNGADQDWAVVGVSELNTGHTNSYVSRNNAFVEAYRGQWVTYSSGTTIASSECGFFQSGYNAYQNATTPIDCGGNCSACSGITSETGRVTGSLSLNSTTHIPAGGSPVINAGDNATYGDALKFPPPIGGGSRIDIGAYEAGASSWPYDFQVQKTITTKDPASQTIRLCWDTAASSCDFTFYWWDAWNIDADARTGAPDIFQVEIDTSTAFNSGRSGVAAGFGALYHTQQASSNRFWDVPAGTLTNGQSYYVRVRTAQTDDYRPTNSAGWSPWSLGFYRFTVDNGTDSTAPTAISNLAAAAPTKAPQLGVTLTWTATGDDAGTGTATTYTLRGKGAAVGAGAPSITNCSDGASLTAVLNASGAIVTTLPSPLATGNAESWTVKGLRPNHQYAFAICASDEVPNQSALSNVVNITTAKYEGYGYQATGGGFTGSTAPTVTLVTNTNDSGAGSFRAAVALGDNQVIMPTVGGSSTVGSQINMQGLDNVTVDGSTAPSPGFTLHVASEIDDAIQLGDASQIIMTYLRMQGNFDWTNNDTQGSWDVFTTDNSSGNVQHLVLDHMTFRDSGDAAVDLWEIVLDATLSYNVIMHNYHPQTTGGTPGKARITEHHNLWAENGERNPQLTTGATGGITDFGIYNSIFYDWSYDPNPGAGYAVGSYGIRVRNYRLCNNSTTQDCTQDADCGGGACVETQPRRSVTNLNIVNNWFKEGPTAGAGAIASTIRYGKEAGQTFPDSEEEAGPGTCQPQGTVVGGTNLGNIWTNGNTLPATACDVYSTVSSANAWADSDAAFTPDATINLCTTVIGVAGTHYPDSDETTVESTVFAALECVLTGSVRGVAIRGGAIR